jgi:hypothetical protein
MPEVETPPASVDAAFDNATFTAPAPPAPTTTVTPSTEVAPAPSPTVAELAAVLPAVTEPSVSLAPPSDALDLTTVGEATRDETGKRWFLTNGQWSQYQSAKKFVQEVQEIIPGVTVAQIQEAIERSHAAEFLMQCYRQGPTDTASIDALLQPFIDVSTAEGNPKAFGAMAVRMVFRLLKIDPDALAYLRGSFNGALIESLKTQARESRDPKVREQKAILVQQLQNALTPGKFDTKEAILNVNLDPEAQRKQELDRRQQELDRRDRESAATRERERQDFVGGQQAHALDDEIIKCIPSAARAAYEKDPTKWPYILQDFRNAVETAESVHPEWRTKLEILRTEALMTMQPQAVSSFVNYWRSIVNSVAKSNGPAILNKWGVQTIAANQTANGAAQNRAPNEPAPNGVNRPGANGVKIDEALLSKGAEAVFAHFKL